jgi:catechol 2,3-dioxygenase-like lactoylglutathione lyase family enzyme
MTIRAINHAQLGFPAGRHAQLRHFYSDLLGLEELRTSDGRTLRFLAGAQRLDLVPVSGWRAPSQVPHLALQVDNLSGLRARFENAGLAIDEAPSPQGQRHFYALDPAGNALEFLEPTIPGGVR